MARSEPVEVPDEEHERIFERVCAIDVAKGAGKVCTRLPHPEVPGRRVTKVWDVDAATGDVIELADHLSCQGIEVVTLESTSDYWRIFFYLLEARGLRVRLVNAQHAKSLPGRPKTDKLDSVWLARGRMKDKHAALIEALTGRFDGHHALPARMLLGQIDTLTGQIDQLTAWIEEHLRTIPAARIPEDDGPGSPGGCDHRRSCTCLLDGVARLDEIPGITPHGAQIILAEAGLDMSRFPTAGHLVSWAKLCPRTLRSGPKNKTGKPGKGNRYLKGVLSEMATAAAKTDTFLGERYRRIVKRRGKLRAMVAVARSILVIIWHLLADPAARFRDLGPDYHTSKIDKDRKARGHIRQLQALGFTVALTPAA